MSGILGIGGGGDSGFYPFSIEQSLRFNDGDTAYLQRTPSSTGSNTHWTISFWIKRCTISTLQDMIDVGATSDTNTDTIQFQTDNTIRIQNNGSAVVHTNYQFRDTAAWYNIVVKSDADNGTNANKLKVYINGVDQDDSANGGTGFSTDNRSSLSSWSEIGSTDPIRIGGRIYNDGNDLDAYLAEFNYIDGVADIDASYFGETKGGIWIPKSYTGSYGTNGFRLAFEDDTTVEGFNTVTYTGTGGSRTVQGVGFQPDLVWIKSRSHSDPHELIDSVRGASKRLRPNDTPAESTASNDGFVSFDSDGFSLDGSGGGGQVNGSGRTYAAWCWDAGGVPSADNSAGAGNTPTANSVKIDGANLGSALAGTIPATRLAANTTRGFSIVTYTGNGTNGTVAHGLGAAPTWIIVKNRDDVDNWAVWHTGIPITKFLRLNDDDIANTPTNARWNDTAPTSTVFSVGDTSTGDNEVNASGDDYVAYCWTDISGYSKMSSYTGNGSSGHAITTGFAPAWLMVKRTDTTDNSWYIADNTRTVNTAAGNDDLLFANLSNTEGSTNDFFTFTSTGFELNTNSPAVNTSGGEYVYMAFADTRDYAFWTDQSGNNNDFQHVNLEHRDVMPDSPTDNKATFNFLNKDLRQTTTLSDGNKTVNFSSGSEGFAGVPLTIFRNEGQAYCEFNIDQVYSLNSTDGMCIFVIDEEQDLSQISSGSLQSRFVGSYCSGGSGDAPAEISSGGADQGGSPTKFRTVGDRVGVYIDYDAGKGFFALNGTVQTVNGTPDIANGTNPHFTFTANSLLTVGAGGVGAGTPGIITLKDDPSDWEYTPPAGYTAFSTAELPDPGIDPNKGETPDEYFNTVTYSGTGASTLAITGVGFQPDWVWAKKRSAADNHAFGDVIRGVQKTLFQTSVQQSSDANGLQSFDSDGFTVGSGSGSGVWGGNSGATYVAWNWKAGGAASTIAADSVSTGVPSVASSVSASPESGFSIVTYTTTGVGDITVGHGLGVAPEFIMAKVFNEDYGWTFFMLPAGVTKALGMANNAAGTSNAWGQTAPTSTVFTAGRPGEENNNFEAGNTVVAYCFAPIEGYSKIGIYEGTGNGTAGKEQFVYTGFRPAFVMIKRIDASAPWTMFDNKRDPDNVVEHILFPNTNDDELSPYDRLDFVSNGFKLRDSGSGVNNDDTIVYFAIAEQPFKYANAR